MPEAFIIKRWDAEVGDARLTDQWREAYGKLTVSERKFVDGIVATNKFNPLVWSSKSNLVKKVLDFYTLIRENIPQADENVNAKKSKNLKKIVRKKLQKNAKVC